MLVADLGRGMVGVVRFGAARVGAGAFWGPSGAFGTPACSGRWLGNGFASSGCAQPQGIVGKSYVGGTRSRMIHGTPSLGQSGLSIVSPPSSAGAESRLVTALFFPGKPLEFHQEISPYLFVLKGS